MCRSRDPSAPLLRVARAVEHGVNRHHSLGALIKDGVRKASYQRSPVVIMSERIQLRPARDALQTCFDRTEELLAQPNSVTLIPGVSFRDVQFGFGCEDDLSGHAAREPFASLLPRSALTLDSSEDS